MNTTYNFNLRPLVAALILAVFHPAAHAIKLGDPVVMSHVGEPLRISIPVVETTPEELASLSVNMATQVNYVQSEIAPPVWLKSANISMERKNGTATVHVTAGVQVDPIADVMIELRWAAGRMLQTVPVFLEPSKSAAQKDTISAPALSAPKPATTKPVEPELVPAAEQPTKNTPKEKQAPNDVVPHKDTVDASGEQSLAVKKGDTLSKLMRPRVTSSASLEQLLVAYTKNNPQAFANGNMNRLRAGVILKAPSAEAIAATSQVEAKQFILAQSRNFGDYSDKLAKQVTEQAALESKNPSQKASGKITGKVQDSSKQAQALDRLTLSKASVDKTKPGEGRSGKREVTEEDRIAMRIELEEAKARLAELEQLVEAQRKLQALKNAAMAQAQAQAEKAQVVQPTPKINPPVPAPQEKPEDQVLTAAWVLDVLANNTLPILGGGLVLASLLLVRARKNNPDLFKFLSKHKHSSTDTFREIMPKANLRSRIHPTPNDETGDEGDTEPKFYMPEYPNVPASQLEDVSKILKNLPDMPPLADTTPVAAPVSAPRANIKFVAPVVPKVEPVEAVKPVPEIDHNFDVSLDLEDIGISELAVDTSIQEATVTPVSAVVEEEQIAPVAQEEIAHEPVVAPFNFTEEVQQIESAALNFLDTPDTEQQVEFILPAFAMDSPVDAPMAGTEPEAIDFNISENTTEATEIVVTENPVPPSFSVPADTVILAENTDEDTQKPVLDNVGQEQGLDTDGKLSLAKLYIDLGDVNGARELLLELVELDDGVSSVAASELLVTLNA